MSPRSCCGSRQTAETSVLMSVAGTTVKRSLGRWPQTPINFSMEYFIFFYYYLLWCHAEKRPTLRGLQDTKRKQTPETQNKDIHQKG